MSICVRRATESDARAIAELESAYIDCPWTEQQIREEIERESAVFLCATVENSVVGYASCDTACSECEMSNIAVSSAYRRCGIGQALLTELISCVEQRGANAIFLLVRSDNDGAIKLYEKGGFAVVGKRKAYYKGSDALIMRLNL